MDDKPLVSIIMPAFDAAPFIRAAVMSVIEQSYPNWELIVINDGSTDDTGEIVRSFRDTRIRYFEKVNGGVSSARNLGMGRMKGVYFCFLDADDVLPRKSIEARLMKFLANPDVDFVDGTVKVYDTQLRNVLRVYTPAFEGSPLKPLFALSDRCFLGATWMIRRKEVEYKMVDGLSHGEDYLFFVALSRDGGRYDFTDEEILHYRRHLASAMHDLSGLHQGYKAIYRYMRHWPEFDLSSRLRFHFRFRKSMFLSYLTQKKFTKALGALFA